MGAPSSFVDETRWEGGLFSCVKGVALVSFTVWLPVSYESKWREVRKSWTIQGGFQTLYVSTTLGLVGWV
jgi:hypothetical protein